ncbi:MAG: glycosyl transferase family 2 [Candidatus Eremiobacteraeota bacterium]|nr:glycosyl transferase family 2 [Candidatus Eremiobacteraeota bacterium]
MERDILPAEIYKEIEVIDSADIVIGIPSYNNAKSIAHVVNAALLGLAKYYPDMKAVIVNSDGGSSDGTPDVFMNANPFNKGDYFFTDLECVPARKMTLSYKGIPGKGSAFRSIFEIAYLLDAELCIVVDSDLRSITPEWFECLGYPILEKDYDYVTPFYLRHKYDGTITNSIAYPFTRAMYGHDLRQPIGGDFGISGTLLPNYISQDVWETDVAKYGIDIWMTTTALTHDYKVAQAFLGCKIHDVKDPGEHLGPMFRQVVSTLMRLAGEKADLAREVKTVKEVPIFGFPFTATPEPLPVNLDRLLEKFNNGFKEHEEAIKLILSPDTFKEIKSLVGTPIEKFAYSPELWVKSVYEYATKIALGGKADLVDTMIPIYYGNVASFVKKTWDMNDEQSERVVQEQAELFFNMREYFLKNLREKVSV